MKKSGTPEGCRQFKKRQEEVHVTQEVSSQKHKEQMQM